MAGAHQDDDAPYYDAPYYDAPYYDAPYYDAPYYDSRLLTMTLTMTDPNYA